MGSALMRNASDAGVRLGYPNRNFGSAKSMYVINFSSGVGGYALIYLGLSVPKGATLTTAKLRVWTGGALSGTQTLTTKKLNKKFTAARVTWNTRPGVVAGAGVTVSKSAPPARTMWEFDVKTLLQPIVDTGGNWYGFRIESNTTTSKWIYSAQATDIYRPQLELAWSDAPDEPDQLVPDNGMAVSVPKPTFRYLFTDVSGDTTLAKQQVQVDDAIDFLTPLFDTGWIDADDPQLDFDDTTYTIPLGQNLFWRARVQDGAGLQSLTWSDPATFIRIAKPVLTLVNPNPVTLVVYDSTPPISWTFPGQKAYQIILQDPALQYKAIWDSGKVTSTDQTVTLPVRKIIQTVKVYRLVLRVWDGVPRATLPDDPAYTQGVWDFTYVYDPTPNPAGSISVAVSAECDAWAVITATRVDQPDQWKVQRDGIIIDDGIEGDSLWVSGTTYRYTDSLASPRHTHVYALVPVVDGKTAAGSPTASLYLKPTTTILSEKDGEGRLVYLMNPNVQGNFNDIQELHQTLDIDAPPVLITQSIGGRMGTAEGRVVDWAGKTAAFQVDSCLQYWRDRPGTELRMTWIDRAMKVMIYDVEYSPKVDAEGVFYDVSFSWYESIY